MRLDEPLRTGDPIGKGQEILTIVNSEDTRFTAFVLDRYRNHVNLGTKSLFIPEDPSAAKVPIEVTGIIGTNSGSVVPSDLLSLNGGPIRTRMNKSKQAIETACVIELRLKVANGAEIPFSWHRREIAQLRTKEKQSVLQRVVGYISWVLRSEGIHRTTFAQ